MVEVENREKERGVDLVEGKGRNEGDESRNPGRSVGEGKLFDLYTPCLTQAPLYSISYVHFSTVANTVVVGNGDFMCLLYCITSHVSVFGFST